MEASKQQNMDLKYSQETIQDKLSQLQNDLQRSESRGNQLELNLQTSKVHLENSSQDNYLREELGRLRRESNAATDKIRELKKTVRGKLGECDPLRISSA